MNIEFVWTKKALPDDAINVRKAVFVDELDLLYEEVFDSTDRYAENVVMLSDGKPIGTGRIKVGNRGECLIDNVAVISSFRNKGLGTRLVLEIEKRCLEKGFDMTYVHSFSRISGFFTSLGYKKTGSTYMMDDIACVNMEKTIFVSYGDF